MNSSNGKLKQHNLTDYKIPTSMDVPKIFTSLVEPIDPVGPFGAKGVAEPSMTPTAACIANAIHDAIGVRVKELPITPDKVLKALMGLKLGI